MNSIVISVVIFVGILTTVVTDCWCYQNSNDTYVNPLKRGKRYLDYLQKSRMFFRANAKVNILQINQLWSHAYGFRANYPIENDKEHRPFRRDVYESLEHLMNHHGFDGRACLLKSFCAAAKIVESEESGMLSKLFKLVFTLEEADHKFFGYLKMGNCEQIFQHHCPLSFNSISPYTDDI